MEAVAMPLSPTTIGDHVDVDWMPALEFEEQWEDPIQSEHTDLDSVPTEATISFPGHEKNGVTAELLIKMAMLDSEATVVPDGDG